MTPTIDRTVARRYAEAFVNAIEGSHRQGASGEMKAEIEELELVAKTYAGSKEFQQFLGSPEIAPEDKKQLMNRLWSQTIGPEGMGLLDLLIRWDRIDHLPALAEEATVIAQARQGILHGQGITARPISSAEVEVLAQAVGNRLGKKVLLERVVDPKLIGGMRIVIGTTVLDGSIQTMLHDIRQKLMDTKVNE